MPTHDQGKNRIYGRLAAQQGERCAICDEIRAEDKKRLAIDHCHETGYIRGLLCHRCNLGLGSFRDSVELLLSAAAYLFDFNGREKDKDHPMYRWSSSPSGKQLWLESNDRLA